MLNFILNALQTRHVFLTGGGGVGKSYITKQIISHYKNSSLNIVVLGSTGIAAVGVGGVTIHSFFRFGICEDLAGLASFDRRQAHKLKELYKMIKNSDLIVIDEISMVSGSLFEMVAYRLRMGGFGGRVLLVGDFYQLPPVKRASNGLFSAGAYAFLSGAWEELNLLNIELTSSKRTSDLAFFEILGDLRVGKITREMGEFFGSKIVDRPPDDAPVLFGRNREADLLNLQRLNALNSQPHTALAWLSVLDESLSDGALKSWIESLNSPMELSLKEGARVIFTRNYTDNKASFYNGEQGVVVGFNHSGDGDLESVVVLKDSGELVEVERLITELLVYELNDDDEPQARARARFSQFALRLAWAITIHKSQGMSLERFVCNIDNIFENGQFYVAMSRALSGDGLFITCTKTASLSSYLNKIIKIDPAVAHFYSTHNFIKEGEL